MEVIMYDPSLLNINLRKGYWSGRVHLDIHSTPHNVLSDIFKEISTRFLLIRCGREIYTLWCQKRASVFWKFSEGGPSHPRRVRRSVVPPFLRADPRLGDQMVRRPRVPQSASSSPSSERLDFPPLTTGLKRLFGAYGRLRPRRRTAARAPESSVGLRLVMLHEIIGHRSGRKAKRWNRILTNISSSREVSTGWWSWILMNLTERFSP